MRRLLITALSVSIATIGVSAAPSQPGQTAKERAEFMAWVQRLNAVHQPIVDAYRRCEPTIKAAMGQDAVEAERLMGVVQGCAKEMQQLSKAAEQGYQDIGPLPTTVQRIFKTDGRDWIKRSSDAYQAMADVMSQVLKLNEAVRAGDVVSANNASIEVRSGIARVASAQLITLELVRKSSPDDSDVSNYFLDYRIIATRAMISIFSSGISSEGVAIGHSLKLEAQSARSSLGGLRTAVAKSRAEYTLLMTRVSDPNLKNRMGAFLRSSMLMLKEAEDLTIVLEQAPTGNLSFAQAQDIVSKLANFEVRIVEISYELLQHTGK